MSRQRKQTRRSKSLKTAGVFLGVSLVLATGVYGSSVAEGPATSGKTGDGDRSSAQTGSDGVTGDQATRTTPKSLETRTDKAGPRTTENAGQHKNKGLANKTSGSRKDGRQPSTPPKSKKTTGVDPKVVSEGKADAAAKSNRSKLKSKGPLDDVIKTYLEKSTNIEPDAKNIQRQVDSFAGPEIVSELEADLGELDANGWTVEGTPKLLNSIVKSTTSVKRKTTVELEACVDSRFVIIKDHVGKQIGKPAATSRAKNLFTLQQAEDGSWTILERSFPANPKC